MFLPIIKKYTIINQPNPSSQNKKHNTLTVNQYNQNNLLLQLNSNKQ